MAGNIPIYNLKAVIHETGLTPATLRAWERRYGLFKPQRSPGGHRLYTENEIEMLKWLVARQAEGLSISQAVGMWRSQVGAEPSPALPVPPPSLPDALNGSVLDNLRQSWVSACMSFDERTAEQVLAQAFAIAAPETVCTAIIQQGLAEIGEGWYSGRVTIQQEHFASALAMRRLHTLFTAAPPPTRPGRILAACPPGEMHEFALLVISYLLRRRGWDVIYLGINVPSSQLEKTIQQVSPHLLLSVAQTLTSAAALREMANTALDSGLVMAFGGGVFNRIPDLPHYIPGHFLNHDLPEVPRHIESLLNFPPALPQKQVLTPHFAALLEDFTAHAPLVVAAVTAAFQSAHMDPSRLEEANTNFTRYIIASLQLGDVDLLDYTISWLEGLVANYGMPAVLVTNYLATYGRAVQQHLGSRAAPLLDWFARQESPTQA